jgi:quinol monooxygenase YgiN
VVIVIARFRPQSDRLDEFLALLNDVQAASRDDDGCLNYGYYRNVGDDLEFIAVEEWRDMDALEKHLKTPHVARLIAALREHGSERLEIAAHTVAHSGPLPLPRRS